MPAKDERYVALLRGINVGGGNLIKMAALKASFEALGFREVATYIASGNVLFTAPRSEVSTLAGRIEKALSAEYGYQAMVVVRSRRQLQAIVTRAPKGFGAELARFRCDVVFLKEPLTSAEAMKSVRVREGVDQAFAGAGVIYFSRVSKLASKSLLPKLASMPVYQRMTIRNWNTTTKLLALE
jgi:uncharacterized protein (DUF1697 family)